MLSNYPSRPSNCLKRFLRWCTLSFMVSNPSRGRLGHKTFVVHSAWYSESRVAPPPPAVILFQHSNSGTALIWSDPVKRLQAVGWFLFFQGLGQRQPEQFE